MSKNFQISVNSTAGELEVSILQSQYSKSGLSCGSGIHMKSSIWQNLEFFSSSIISRTVGGGKRRLQNGRLHWAEIDDHLVQGVQYEAGPGSQDKKCAASQSHHST